MPLVLSVEPLWISPYVFACYVTLTEKRLPFETVVLDSNVGQTRTSEYLVQTVTGRVPSLVDDGFALAESSAIVEYLEERFPEPPVLPASLLERARCRQLMSWLRSDETAPIRDERPSTSIFHRPPDRPLGAPAEQARAKLEAVVLRLVGERETLFDRWCIADAELAFMLMRLLSAGDPLDPRVERYARTQWQRPSVQSFALHPRPPH